MHSGLRGRQPASGSAWLRKALEGPWPGPRPCGQHFLQELALGVGWGLDGGPEPSKRSSTVELSYAAAGAGGDGSVLRLSGGWRECQRQQGSADASEGVEVPEAVLEAGVSWVGLQQLEHLWWRLQAHLLCPVPALQTGDPCAGPVLPGQVKLPQQLQHGFLPAGGPGLLP